MIVSDSDSLALSETRRSVISSVDSANHFILSSTVAVLLIAVVSLRNSGTNHGTSVSIGKSVGTTNLIDWLRGTVAFANTLVSDQSIGRGTSSHLTFIDVS